MSPTTDPVAELWQRSDLITPMAIRVAVTLGLADHLADGPRTIEDLADRSGADPSALGRLVRFLAHVGIVEVDHDDVRLGPVGEPLRTGHESNLSEWLNLEGFGGRMDGAITRMRTAVRDGRPVWEDAWGRPFWEDLDANPHIAESFNDVMATGSAGASAAEIAERYDFTELATIVDVGGGSGAMLATIAERHPHVTGSVLELGHTAAEARTNFTTRRLADRLSAVEGSMFDAVPPGADLYLLVRVLHDWNDDDAQRILANCAAAAAAGNGRILIVDGLLSDDNPGVSSIDLRMMLLVGGRERSATDFRALADASGLDVIDIQPLDVGNGASAMIECAPREDQP